MCLAYTICTLPNRLLFSVFANHIVGKQYTDTVFLASNTLMYTRNAINVFFLYVSVHGFRRDVLVLAQKCRVKIKGNQIQPNGINEQNRVRSISVIRRLPTPIETRNL